MTRYSLLLTSSLALGLLGAAGCESNDNDTYNDATAPRDRSINTNDPNFNPTGRIDGTNSGNGSTINLDNRTNTSTDPGTSTGTGTGTGTGADTGTNTNTNTNNSSGTSGTSGSSSSGSQ